MSVSPLGVALVAGAMVVESCAQLCLKLGSAAPVRPAPGVSPRSRRAWIAVGVAAYVVEIALYTLALRLMDVSVAFPLGSLCFVGVALLSRLVLREAIGWSRGLGIGLILAGVVLLAV